MRMLQGTLFFVLGLVADASVLWGSTSQIPLPFIDGASSESRPSVAGSAARAGVWQFESTGSYEGWSDRRDLFVIRHPWSPGRSGSYGSVSREVEVPEAWTGPLSIHFYMTDDYFGQGADLPKDSWASQVKLIGHRFKQVLVNDVVVWERDVADIQEPDAAQRFSARLPEHVRPGSRFRLKFRMIDKVGSDQRLAEDHRVIGQLGGMKEAEEWEFQTHLYVGDVLLAPADVVDPVSESSPIDRLVRKVHDRNWPLPSYGERIEFPVALTLEYADRTKGVSCPVRCGLPIPPGQIRTAEEITLKGGKGRPLPLQTEVLTRWPDGSPRWVQIDTIVGGEDGSSPYTLDIDKRRAPRPALKTPAAIQQDVGGGFVLQSGSLVVRTGGAEGQLLGELSVGKARFSNLTAEIQVGERVFRPVIDKAEVMAAGPVRAEAQLAGRLVADGETMGPCVFRVAVFAGQPGVRMTWRIFNHRQEAQAIRRLDLLGQLRADGERRVVWSSKDQAAKVESSRQAVCVRQLKNDGFETLDGTGQALANGEVCAGWLGVQDDIQTFMVLVRHFREQFPKAIELRDNRLRISLFESHAGQETYGLTEGEAKRHEIWLGLWDKTMKDADLASFAACFDRPARLFSADYACLSGGFGHAARHDEKRFSDFHEIVRSLYGDIRAEQFYVNGIRNWGDQPYSPSWCNGYYNVQMGLIAEYIMTGDPRWFDHLEASVRHIMDVDICHASARHPEWVGALHCGHCGKDHTDSYPWAAMQKNWGTLAYYRLAGDPDARAAALGMADAVIRARTCMGSCGSVRDHAGTMYCLTAAYDETGDAQYLKACREVMNDALRHIDRRRGTYVEVHGSVSYRGNVPWMGAQLAESLYLYYRQSGDVDAAIALVGLAESILSENRNREVPGDVFGYSHNPQFGKSGDYHVLIAPAVLHAYELTGDPDYLNHAWAMYRQMIRDRKLNSVRNCYWPAPTLLYYLQRYGEPPTASAPASRVAP